MLGEGGEPVTAMDYSTMETCFWEGEEVLVPATVTMTGADPRVAAPSRTVSGGGPASSRGIKKLPVHPPGGLAPIHPRSGSRSLRSFYDLDSVPLGRGSYGEVTVATHIATGARRAVKSIHKARLGRHTQDVLPFILREVEILTKLDHPSVVKLYETFEDEDHAHLVLELCDGGDLLQRIILERERLLECDVSDILAQIFGAVQHMHRRGVVHRDLKPENFLFAHREPEREPRPPMYAPLKLIDFGLSRGFGPTVGARSTPKIGTREYMAPEAFAGMVSCEQAEKADIWSCGIVLHASLIGQFPSPLLQTMSSEEYVKSRVLSHVSPAGRDLLAQLLRQDSRARPTAAMCLRHHWFSAWGCGVMPVGLEAVDLASAVCTFAAMPGLQRLALAATAREMEDADVFGVRQQFRFLEQECNGALTAVSLERLGQRLRGPIAIAAQELALAFTALDLDASGTIGWSELLAAARVGAMSNAGGLRQRCEEKEGVGEEDREHPEDNTLSYVVTPDQNGDHRVQKWSDDSCWRAFELLSQGAGVVSAESLCSLFAQSAPLFCRMERSGNNLPKSRFPQHADLEHMLLEIDPCGRVDGVAFAHLVGCCGLGDGGL